MPKPESSRHHAVVALLVLAAIWGYNWVQMKIAVQYASPFMVAALRITLGSLSLLLVMVALRKPLKPQAIPETCLLGLLQTAGVYTFATWALVSGGAGKTAVLVYTMPFWTVILAWILLKERVRGWQWVAIALSFAGLLLILDPSSLTGTILSKVLALLAGICWAGGAIVAKQLQQKITIDLLSLTTWQGGLCGNSSGCHCCHHSTPANYLVASIYRCAALQRDPWYCDRHVALAIYPQPLVCWFCRARHPD